MWSQLRPPQVNFGLNCNLRTNGKKGNIFFTWHWDRFNRRGQFSQFRSVVAGQAGWDTEKGFGVSGSNSVWVKFALPSCIWKRSDWYRYKVWYYINKNSCTMIMEMNAVFWERWSRTIFFLLEKSWSFRIGIPVITEDFLHIFKSTDTKYSEHV